MTTILLLYIYTCGLFLVKEAVVALDILNEFVDRLHFSLVLPVRCLLLLTDQTTQSDLHVQSVVNPGLQRFALFGEELQNFEMKRDDFIRCLLIRTNVAAG